jgi:hypothetical protein
MNVFLDDFCPEKLSQERCPSLASLLALLGRIPALLWVTDTEGRFTSLTGQRRSTPVLTLRQYTGKPVTALFPCLETKPWTANCRTIQGHACSFHTEVNGRDMQAHLEPLYSSDGTVAGAIGVALDLTERMVAEGRCGFRSTAIGR